MSCIKTGRFPRKRFRIRSWLLGLLIFGLSSAVSGVEKINLTEFESPILFEGDNWHAYRDPAAVYEKGVFYLFYTYVEIEEDDRIYSYVAFRKSQNLKTWSPQKTITPKDQKLNYCSPGGIVRFKDKWILCFSSYPRPGYIRKEIPRYGDETARAFIMSGSDLENWSEPKLLRLKGPEVPREKMGRIIDPYLVEDKDQPGKWWCFYKQNGVKMSCSSDLETWTYFGRVDAGENACVLVQDGRYFLIHSPSNGMGIKISNDLKKWCDWGELITLGQKDWEWARGRLTAGFVLDLRQDRRVGKYLLFFHGSGPETEKTYFDTYASLGIAWSDDLIEWDWPGKNTDNQ